MATERLRRGRHLKLYPPTAGKYPEPSALNQWTTMIDFGVSERKAKELEQRMAACGLIEADLEERFVRSQGPGGQHVNKTATSVILKHRPTGLQIKVQQGRSQSMNRFFARRRLCELLEARQLGDQSPAAQRIAKIRKQKDRRKRRRKRHSPRDLPSDS